MSPAFRATLLLNLFTCSLLAHTIAFNRKKSGIINHAETQEFNTGQEYKQILKDVHETRVVNAEESI